MNLEVKKKYGEALIQVMPLVRDLLPQFKDPYMGWVRSEYGWTGKETTVPNWSRIDFGMGAKLWETAKDFTQAFAASYPEYLREFAIGTMTSLGSFGSQAPLIMSAIRALYDRHGTLEIGPGDINAIVDEFAEFMDAKTVEVAYTAQLVNFSMDGDHVDLSDGVLIRRLTEEEVSATHGVVGFGHFKDFGRDFAIHDCALVHKCQEKKLFGADALVRRKRMVLKFEQALMALRTFKAGHVGYEGIRCSPARFCPYDLPEYGHCDLFVPMGSYRILASDVEALEKHAAAVLANQEPAMRMACSRLADAETRLRPEDRLVDAVIGLEALLLANLDSSTRGELKYRFALHYSTFGASAEERYEAFRVAKDLYDVRSTIAHGGRPKSDGFRIGLEKVQLPKAAEHACDVLRFVIRRLITDSRAPYKKSDYWERRYFDL